LLLLAFKLITEVEWVEWKWEAVEVEVEEEEAEE
jgi:hypothetical protein